MVVGAKIDHDLPGEAGAVVGDIAHNVRSALDGLVWELARLHTGRDPGCTQFPIFREPAGFEHDGRRMVRDLAVEHADFIERLQPYHEGDL